MRDDYFDWISYYRAQGCRFCYQDETWVFKNMTSKKVWTVKEAGNNNVCCAAPSGS